MGTDAPADMQMFDPHARMMSGAAGWGRSPAPARFYIAPQKRYLEALLDFIMVSPDLAGPDLETGVDALAHLASVE